MATVDIDVVRHMLQALEHLLDTVDRTSTVAGHLLQAEQGGTPLAPATLTAYEQQLSTLTRQRESMREVIARWWTLVEDGPPH
jgi:hypothetical protein